MADSLRELTAAAQAELLRLASAAEPDTVAVPRELLHRLSTLTGGHPELAAELRRLLGEDA
jgi:hypothetical protein